jgi:hypothetical protein
VRFLVQDYYLREGHGARYQFELHWQHVYTPHQKTESLSKSENFNLICNVTSMSPQGESRASRAGFARLASWRVISCARSGLMSTWRAANRIEYIPYLNEFYSVESIQYIEQVGPIEIAYIRLSVRPHLFSNPLEFSTWLESNEKGPEFKFRVHSHNIHATLEQT